MLAVVVARDPGPGFDQTLISLGSQRYPQLGVVVIDLCEHRRLDARIAELMPAAIVHRPADIDIGYSEAVNIAVGLDVRTTYYLFCHDDVYLDPEAVGAMVEEATNSRAAVVGPKYVEWDDPTTLLHVGQTSDKFAVTGELAGAGEFDQGQRDAVADVIVTPGGVQLVHEGLYQAIGGYDEEITLVGEDVDLCWRAQVAGARVVVAPAAVVRHVEDLESRVDVDVETLARRHELRTVLGTYGVLSLALILPQQFFLTLVSALVSLVTLRFRRAASTVGAWTWNLRRLGSLRARRSQLQSNRQIPDRELRHLQQRGSIRAGRFLHGIADSDEGVVAQSRSAISERWSDSPRRIAAMVGLAFLVLYLFGSRRLLPGIPFVGEFARFPEGIEGFVTQWWGGWRPPGLGDAGATPIGLGLLGFANIVLLGSTGLLRAVSILGLIPIGVFGAWRMLRVTTSNRARLVCAVVYAANPAVYNAVARAQWTPLIAYAAAPYLFGTLARFLGATPFGHRGGPAGPSGDHSLLRLVVAGGLAAGLVVAFAPIAAIAIALIAAGLAVGSICGGHPANLIRLAFGSVSVVAVAAALNAPFLIDIAQGGTWATVGSAADAYPTDTSLVDMFRFDIGPIDVGWLGWAVYVPAMAGLLFSNGWRLAWAVRGWFVALGAWGLAWADQWGSLPVAFHQTELLLSVAALGLAVASGMAALSIEADLAGRRRWIRRGVPAAALAALVLFAVPAAGATFDGRWSMPKRDLAIPLSVLDDPVDEGGFRALWIGEPDVLGLRGYRLDGTLAFGTSDDREPSISYRWIDEPSDGANALGDQLRIAIAGQENRLGARLADFGVRYVVVVERLGERPFGEVERPVDPEVLTALSEQLDLRRVDGVNQAVTIFENSTLASTRRSEPRATEEGVDVSAGTAAVLPAQTGPAGFAGILGTDRNVIASYNADKGWSLRVSGEERDRTVHNEWANAFAVSDGGDGELSFEASPDGKIARGAQLAGWIVLGMLALRLATSRAAKRRRST